MTSLYYVTEHVKIVGKWAGIGVAAIIGLMLLFKFGVFVKDIIAPTPPPPPTVSWGKLLPLMFPPSSYAENFTYKINTLSGTLPGLPDRTTVNLLATPEASLQSLNNAQKLVSNVNFNQEGIRIAETIYQWTKTDSTIPTLEQKLQYDIISKNFGLSSNYLINDNIINTESIPDETQAQSSAEDFLSNLDAFPSDFDATKSAVTLFSIENNALVKTTSLSNTQAIRIDFFQKDINGLPIYYTQYPQALTYVIIGGDNSQGTVLETEYLHQTITDISATYPIYTVNEAFDLLKKGQGYIASYNGSSLNIGIQDVKLGYYLSKDTNTYLMPIVIFEGNNNFVAYVSAIKEEWISK